MMKSLLIIIRTMFLTAVLVLSAAVFSYAAQQRVSGGIDGSSAQKTGRVIMVVIDHLSWDDISEKKLPVMTSIIDAGAIGLMTTNPGAGGLRTPENTYVTIGASAKILGGDASGQGFNVQEEYENGRAYSAYYKRIGIKAHGEVVNLGIAQMETANQDLKYSHSAGSIGTVLNNYGVKTGVLGNSDVFTSVENDKFRRFAVNIAMDRNGQVDYGEVGSLCLTPDKEFLGGIRTDYNFLLKKFKELKNKVGFLVIETGDISRLENQSIFTSPEALRKQKNSTLARIDGFLGGLLKEINLKKDLLMIVTPGPSNLSMDKGNFLTPYIMAGQGIKPGIVYSGTTRREGLISNSDIAATVIRFFGFAPVITKDGNKKDVILNGQAIEGIPSANPVGQISDLNQKILFMHNARYPFVKIYINLCLISLIIAVGALRLDIKAAAFINPLLLAVTFIPAVFMLADFMTEFSLWSVGLMMGIITIFMILFSVHLSKILRFSPFIISSGFTVAILIFDIFAGGYLAKSSPLSYDATAGARFYGIGNEYMGILIGAALTCITLIFEKFKSGASILIKCTAVLMLLIVVYTITAPNLGTNAGGAIAAISGLGTAGIIIFGRKFSVRAIAPIAVVTVSILAVFVFFDFTRSVETQSHMGKTVGLIQQNGFNEILNIISRKSEVNLKLIKYTTWSWYFFLSLGVLVFRKKLFPSETGIWEKQCPWFHRMLPGFIVGCLTALIFNDSGIVAAATMISFGISPLLWELLRIKERLEQ